MQLRYLLAGRELLSDLPLPSLTPLPDRSPRAVIEGRATSGDLSGAGASDAGALELVASGGPFEEPRRWLYTERWDETGEPWRAVGVFEREGAYLVRLFGFADFLLERGGRIARVFVPGGAPRGALEPLFLEQVLPLWWGLLGRPCLHASAVAWGEGERARAIAFAGVSGAGKSTLATSLARESGLLSDDCLALDVTEEAVIVHPGHRAVRLWADSAEAMFASPEAGEPSPGGGKRRVTLPVADRGLALARVYVLEPAEEAEAPRASRLTMRDAVSRLAGCLFRIDPDDVAQMAAELDVLARIASHVAVVRLLVPRRFSALAEARAVIEADLAGDRAKK